MSTTTAYGIPTIAAAAWNETRARARRNRPFSGSRVRLHWTPDGVVVSAEGNDEIAHPWQLSPRWRVDPDIRPLGGEWVAEVRPGFVNGRDVTIQQKRRVKTEDGDVEKDVPVPLTDEEPPLLVLGGFRAPDAFPDFFDSLCVVPSTKPEEPDPTRTRQIRAADIVLITPRLATRQTVNVSDPFSTGQMVDIGIVFVSDQLRSAPSAHRLAAVPKWEPPQSPTALDRLMGTAVEPQTDELLIATLYMVSPPDAAEDAEPDASWTCFPIYRVFWNLAHASRAQMPEAPPKPITLTTGLVGGMFDGFFNALLSPVNDAAAQISAFLGAANFAGMYWSPGGLGFDTRKRPEAQPAPASAGGGGLDPKTRRNNREAEAAKKRASVEPLNPPFPHLRTRFDPWFFALQDEPPAPGGSRRSVIT